MTFRYQAPRCALFAGAALGALAVAGAALGALAVAAAARADDAPVASTVSQVVVTAPSSISGLGDLPTTTESIAADQIAKTVNVVTPEDTLRYLPNILIRQRHIGDTQSPVTTRTSGRGASARSLVATRFDYLKSRQRIPTGALPAAFSGGAGTTASLDDTGWYTLDAKGTWRSAGSPNIVTFGAHEDGFKLNNPKYALSDWINGSAGATLTFSRGRTETQALWLQDVWSITPPGLGQAPAEARLVALDRAWRGRSRDRRRLDGPPAWRPVRRVLLAGSAPRRPGRRLFSGRADLRRGGRTLDGDPGLGRASPHANPPRAFGAVDARRARRRPSSLNKATP